MSSMPGCGSPRPGSTTRRAALTALDQAIGDGDHGTNMDRGFAAIVALLDAGPPEGDGDRRRRRRRACGPPGGRSSARSAARPGRCTARRSCGPAAPSPRPSRAARPTSLVAALDAAIGGDRSRSARPPPARRRCSTPSSRRSTAGRAAPSPAGRMSPRVTRGDGRRGRGRRRRDDPAAGDQGSRLLSRRALDRPPGSRARRRRRCSCAPWPTPSPVADRSAGRRERPMARGGPRRSPGFARASASAGVLPSRPPTVSAAAGRDRRAAAARPGGRGASACARARARPPTS